VPDLHADPVSGLQFVNTFKGHAHPSTPVKLLMLQIICSFIALLHGGGCHAHGHDSMLVGRH
jgi:hypothetical protein